MPECLGKRLWISSCRPVLLALVAVVSAASTEPVHAGQSSAQLTASGTHPVIPGFERFFGAAGTDRIKGGTLLLNELNCTSCHQPKSADAKQAPILSEVGSRVKRSYLRKFLSHPQAAKPGTAMPDVFDGLTDLERTGNADPCPTPGAPDGQGPAAL
jgi:hypothetical protein